MLRIDDVSRQFFVDPEDYALKILKKAYKTSVNHLDIVQETLRRIDQGKRGLTLVDPHLISFRGIYT